MAAQGRKNVHGKAGVRFKAPYTASKNKSMLRNVVTDLVIYGEVKVTSGVTKELKTLADHMVTLAKQGDLAARRQAARVIRPIVIDEAKGTTALDKLFSIDVLHLDILRLQDLLQLIDTQAQHLEVVHLQDLTPDMEMQADELHVLQLFGALDDGHHVTHRNAELILSETRRDVGMRVSAHLRVDAEADVELPFPLPWPSH
jgi:ribosomal protein L17